MVIDAHTHIGSALNFVMTEDMLLQSMKKYRIAFSLFSNVEGTEVDHQQNPIPPEFQKTQEEVYKKSLIFARKHTDILGVLPWCRPLFEGLTDEFTQMIEDNLDITYGIKVHPFHSATRFDSETVQDYIKVAQYFKLPVLTHTGSGEYDNCKAVLRMAEKYPDVNFVMAHMGLGTDNKEATEFIIKQPNLYGDTAWMQPENALRCIERGGGKKLIFGSDNTIDGVDTYYDNGRGEPSIYRIYMAELKSRLSPMEYADLMYRNAVRVYNIERFDGE